MFPYEILLNDINSCKRAKRSHRQNDKIHFDPLQSWLAPKPSLSFQILTPEGRALNLTHQSLILQAM